MTFPPERPEEKSGMATASLVCGILAPFTCLATALPAIITGHLASAQAGGSSRNRKAAKWGLRLGYGSFALIPVVLAAAGLIAPLMVKSRKDGQLMEVMGNVRNVGTALREFSVEHGTDTEPFPADLRQLDAMGITTNVERLLALPPFKPGAANEWLYFSAADPENGEAPLLVSPALNLDFVVLTVDQSVKTLRQPHLDRLVKSSPTPAVKIPAPVKAGD